MADGKISELPGKTIIAGNDEFPLHDVSEGTESVASKKAQRDDILGQLSQGRRYIISNPHQGGALRLKVQLHCHANQGDDDGADTKTALVTAYKNAGYHACAITGHDTIYTDPEVADITFIRGVEEEDNCAVPTCTNYNSFGHVVAYGVAAVSGQTHIKDKINAFLAAGAYLNIPHTFWTVYPNSASYLTTLRGFGLVEVANALGTPAYDDTNWRRLLSRGKHVWCIAVDDTHNIANAEFNTGYVEVMADANTEAALLAAIKAGNMYACQTGSPQMTITVSGNVITGAFGAAAIVYWYNQEGYLQKTESNVTSSNYTITGSEGCVYCIIKDNETGTHYAWSQPIWLLGMDEPTDQMPLDISCYMHASGAQTLGNAAWTAINMSATRENGDHMCVIADYPSRIYILITGKYTFSGAVGFAANNTGKRLASVRLNGATYFEIGGYDALSDPTAVTYVPISAEYPLIKGDYVELMGMQTSGGNLDTAVVANVCPEFRASFKAKP